MGILEIRFWNKVDKTGSCWIWLASVDKAGYGNIGKCRFSTILSERSAHRVSYYLTFGEIPHGSHILHTCDNPPCVNPYHLFLGTHQDNMMDMRKKGRMSNPPTYIGSRHPMAVLKESDVLKIRELYSRGMRIKEIAEIYGVHRSSISLIVNRRTWLHI